MEALSRLQCSVMSGANSHVSMTCVRHGNGKRYEPRSGFDVAYRESKIFAPYVDDGSATAVVAGIHAEKIIL
jgi:hypothetical protein